MELDSSPTVKAKHRARTKNDILELVEKQFSNDATKKQTMFGRAMQIYNEHKERSGVPKSEIARPETMAHFHIEAFGDEIECNRYEESEDPI